MQTSGSQPQRALATLDALTAAALVKAAVKSPTLLLGVVGVLAVFGFGLTEHLRTGPLDAPTTFWIAMGLGVLVSMGVASRTRTELEGPFGFVLIRPGQRMVLILRRAGIALALIVSALIVAVAIAQPQAWAGLTPLAFVGAAAGVVAGTGLGWLFSRASAPRLDGSAWAQLLFQARRLAPALAPIGLIALAVQARFYGAESTSQILAMAAAATAVLAALPVDPAKLTMLAGTPQSMLRLIGPLAIRPAAVGVLAGAAAVMAVGLPVKMVLAAAVALGAVGALARVFLGLAALGRSEKAARTAGAVELMLALILPIAGPLAIGVAALGWIGVRLVWLWRRGRRVRWLDPEGER